MKIETETVKRVWYVSDVASSFRTLDEETGNMLAIIDKKYPTIYRIVLSAKSRAWGRTSTHYTATSTPIERATRLLCEVDRPPSEFFAWSARFTIEHFDDKKLKSGFFQQFDGQHDRGCVTLDYTPALLDTTIERFLKWCDSTYKFPTTALKIDKKIIRRYDPPR